MAVVVELSAVIVAIHDERPHVLTVQRDGRPALPSGPFDPSVDRTLDRAMRRWGQELTGVPLGFVEQLYTFGDIDRDPSAAALGERRLSIAYLAFVGDITTPRVDTASAQWLDAYELLPWEDRRDAERTPSLDVARNAVGAWCDAAVGEHERLARVERADVCWSTAGAPWDPVRSLERYELLFEAGFVEEAGGHAGPPAVGGIALALDHRRIFASALGRVRGKLTYRPVVFELLPPTFTLSALQRVVEALVGVRLHKQNFRRLVESARLVEGTGMRSQTTAGRPAELFRFRREVLRERPTRGMGLPGRR